MFCEPLLAGARHVEVQVLADAHGTVWALAERDCSVQRRYQKVIEETPSPAVDERAARRLLAAAAARSRAAVGYRGAGTAEFLVTGDGRVLLPGVQHQAAGRAPGHRVRARHRPGRAAARGSPRARRCRRIRRRRAGHAIEARLYAEDPADGYRPASGLLHALDVPDWTRGSARRRPGPRPGLRLDSGVEAGSEISPHYDADAGQADRLGADRAARPRGCWPAPWTGARIHGPATNRDLLVQRAARTRRSLAGGADTSLLDGYDLAGLVPGGAGLPAVGGGRRRWPARRRTGPRRGWRPGCPAAGATWSSQPQRTAFDGPRGRVEVGYLWRRDGIAWSAGLRPAGRGDPAVRGDSGREAAARAIRWSARPDHAVLEVAGVRYRFDVARAGDTVWVDSAPAA